jgi:hypothetical protein
MTLEISIPNTTEYAPYYGRYVEPASARGDVLATLPRQIDEIKSALGNLTDEQALFRDAPNEWTIKEVLGHMNDVERIFAYRLICISHNDQTPLPGFEQDDYVREAGFNNYPIADLISEFEFLRRANILAIKNITTESTLRLGTASGNPVSARALIYIMVGHVEHHMASLHEKYLPPLKS